jgi:hypothetical protein
MGCRGGKRDPITIDLRLVLYAFSFCSTGAVQLVRAILVGCTSNVLLLSVSTIRSHSAALSPHEASGRLRIID